LTSYTPNIPSSEWSEIKPFVTAAVTEAAPSTAYSEAELFTAVTPLVLWAWKSAGVLQRDHVFAQPTIEKYVGEGMTNHTDASRGTIRSRLLRASEALLNVRTDRTALQGLRPSDASAPFNADELVELRVWAKAQPTAARKISAGVLLSLGIGAGLQGNEIIAARVGDIDLLDQGAVIRVRGEREREVPVLRRWEKPLINRVKNGDLDSFVFREQRKTENHNLITDFISRSEAPFVIQARRMRSTWLVHHIDNGTPVVPFMQAAGIQSLEALDRFLPYAATYDGPHSVAVLR
jgi:integrase